MLKLKCFYGVFTEWFQRRVIRCFTSRLFLGVELIWFTIIFTSHWVGYSKLVPLGSTMRYISMGIFHTVFLSDSHRVTIINAGTLDSFNACFNYIWNAEFRTSVCKQVSNHREESIGSKTFFPDGRKQGVQHPLYIGSSGMTGRVFLSGKRRSLHCKKCPYDTSPTSDEPWLLKRWQSDFYTGIWQWPWRNILYSESFQCRYGHQGEDVSGYREYSCSLNLLLLLSEGKMTASLKREIYSRLLSDVVK